MERKNPNKDGILPLLICPFIQGFLEYALFGAYLFASHQISIEIIASHEYLQMQSEYFTWVFPIYYNK